MLQSRWELAFAITACAALVLWPICLRPVNRRVGPSPVALNDGWARSSPAAQGFDEVALRAAAVHLMDRPLNIHSVLVERHGRIVTEEYQGGPDRSVYSLLSIRRDVGPETLHDLRSVGKTVTSLLYGIALADGRVPAADAPVAVAFPALTGKAARNAQLIRMGDLLDMSSGLAWTEEESGINDELRLFWKSDLPSYVLDRPLVTLPGKRFNYNGGGTALLAQAIASGTGQTIDRYASERLFGPLRIRSWEWMTDVHGRPMPFNGLRLTPRGLLKIGALVLNNGRWNGREVVPAAWIASSWTPGLETGVADFSYRRQWWSGTVRWKGNRLAWHAAFGNGGQRLFVVPGLDLAIVTTAGAYDDLTTAIAVNNFLQSVVSTIQR